MASSASSEMICGSRRCIVLRRSGLRNFTSQIPGGSRIPPRALESDGTKTDKETDTEVRCLRNVTSQVPGYPG